LKIELLFITPNAEKLIETAGRTSYLSFDKQGEGSEKKICENAHKKRAFLRT